ncbi:hypothetical protein [Myxococcus sp. Y35]|uniref:hypothetical protein n=1 Tax=Pseudomyxococcus flavus TaxID=3115648 RepID=UPI003CEE3C75
MRVPLLAVLLAVPAALSCSASASAPESPYEAFFRRPDRVQIFLADYPRSWGGDRSSWPTDVLEEDLPHSGEHYVLPREGPELTWVQRRRLAASFIPPQEPNPYPLRKCGFNPDIALRYWRGDTWMDVVICLGCIKFAYLDAKGNSVPDEQVGYLKDPDLLMELATAAFPKEKFRQGW